VHPVEDETLAPDGTGTDEVVVVKCDSVAARNRTVETLEAGWRAVAQGTDDTLNPLGFQGEQEMTSDETET
jgi:hypothetical protein